MDSQRAVGRRGIGACIAVAMLASLGLTALPAGRGSQHAARQRIVVTLRTGTTTVSGADGLVAGLTMVSVRSTRRAPANFALVRLRPGKSLADLRAATQDVPEGVITLPTSFFRIRPGQSFVTSVNLPPGDYVAAQPPSLGAAAQFSVAHGSAGGSPPTTTGTVLLYDYGIRAPAVISGRGTLEIDNIGENFHFLVGLRLNPGVDPDRVVADFRAGVDKAGRQPGLPVEIVGLVGPGTTNYVQTNLKRGTYVIACLNSDRHSAGHEHSQFGMERKLIVK